MSNIQKSSCGWKPHDKSLESRGGRKLWWFTGRNGEQVSGGLSAGYETQLGCSTPSLLLPTAARKLPCPVRSLPMCPCRSQPQHSSCTYIICQLHIGTPTLPVSKICKLSGALWYRMPLVNFAVSEQVFPQLVLTFVKCTCLLCGFLVHSNRNQISDPFPELLQLVHSQVTWAALVVAFGASLLVLLMAHFICHQAAHSSGLAKSFGNPWQFVMILADLIYVLCHLKNLTDCW